MTFVISATLEGIASEDLSLDGGRTLVQFLANEVYHYVENALHVLVSQSVEPVRIFQSKSEVILVHDLLFGLHIDGLLHVAHDFFKIKGFFFLFISPFEAFAFVLILKLLYGQLLTGTVLYTLRGVFRTPKLLVKEPRAYFHHQTLMSQCR